MICVCRQLFCLKEGLIQSGCAGLTHCLRDEIARFLKCLGKRRELRLCKPQYVGRYKNVGIP